MSIDKKAGEPVKIFYSYAHYDKQWKEKLATHLRIQKHQGLMTDWGNQDIRPGQEWKKEIDKHLEDADIILLIVSSYFIATNYCETTEVETALRRHDAGEAWVIPIILRATDWGSSSIGKLQQLPRENKPIIEWTNKDHILAKIAQDIRSLVIDLYKTKNNIVDNKPEEENTSDRNSSSKVSQKAKRRDLYKAIKKAKDERNNWEKFGDSMQDFLSFWRENFSTKALLKRGRGLLSVFLFFFVFLDILVLPYFTHLWTGNFLITLVTFLLTSSIFFMGVTNKRNNVIPITICLLYLLSYTAILYFPINQFFHLKLPFFSILIMSFIISLLQLVLFRSPYKR